MTQTEQSSHKIGWIKLAPDIRPRHGWVFLSAAFFSIGLMTFVAIGQAYVLNEHLKIPTSQQGSVSGDLVFWTEIIALLCFIPAGILIDRVGRRVIYMLGFFLLAAAYTLYPLATSVADLFLIRTVYALGIVAVAGALSTVLVDYPAEPSRGKLVAIVGFLNGLGIVVINQFFGALPEMLTKAGMSGTEAGLYTHLGIATIAIAVGIMVGFGLKRGTPIQHTERPTVRALFLSGFANGKNPRILISYGAAFIARGDQSVNATFLVLWGSTAGVAAGMESAEAVKNGTVMFIVAQVSALVWAPILGPILDRFDRVSGLAACMVLGAIGNLSVILLADPLANYALIFYILLGIGQISVFLSAQSLIGQEAPDRTRGATIGAFNVSGAVGILIVTWLGGRMFDAIDPRAPFVLVGCINILLFFASLYVRLRARPSPSIAVA